MSSPMITPARNPGLGKVFSGFIRRVMIVVLLCAIVIGALFYFMYSYSYQWNELIPSVSAVICGMFSGFFSRLVYRNRPKFVRWIFSSIGAGIALAIAGLIGYSWRNIDLTGILSAAIEPDFAILFAMSSFSAFLTVYAWSRRIVQVQPKSNLIPVYNEPAVDGYFAAPASPTLISRSSRHNDTRRKNFSILPESLRKTFRKSSWRRIKRQWSHHWSWWLRMSKQVLKSLSGNQNKQPRLARKSVSRLQIRVPEHRVISPVISPNPLQKKHPGRRIRHSVRFFGKEELRCPYCLQIIQPDERKDMVVCPICHSGHHKECWDITGSCQVPHNHAVL